MNPDWLLKHFEQISEAPDAIPRLRRVYLEYRDYVVQISQMPSGELVPKKSQMASGQSQDALPEPSVRTPQMPSAQLAIAFPLSWSQYQLYLSSKEDLKKRLMEWAEAAQQSKSGER